MSGNNKTKETDVSETIRNGINHLHIFTIGNLRFFSFRLKKIRCRRHYERYREFGY